MERILVINPGSTSTKLAIYQGEVVAAETTLRHPPELLSRYKQLYDQYLFRKEAVLRWLADSEKAVDDFTAVVARGGLTRPIPGGTYEVGPALLVDLASGRYGEHAANLGARLAFELAKGRPAFIVDPVVVDELQPLARLSGLPGVARRSIFHALNQKAVARRFAQERGRRYAELRLIVAHLGGGITVGAHVAGRVIDVNNGLDGEGPFSPERAGSLPTLGLARLCFSWLYTLPEMRRKLVGEGGLMAHCGTHDALALEARLQAGDPEVELVYGAMAYQVAKEIGRAAAVLEGQIDAILLTGGLAHSASLVGWISERVSWLAPVATYPGEGEMRALAEGALRVLRGEEQALVY